MTTHPDLTRAANPWANAVPPPYVPPATRPEPTTAPAPAPAPAIASPVRDAAVTAAPTTEAAPLTGVQRAGAVITVVGIVVCGFLAYQLMVTDLIAARSQELLRPRLEERFVVERSLASTVAAPGAIEDSRAAFDAGSGTEPTDGATDAEASGDDEITRDIEQPPLGEPIALLRIPSLDVSQVVVEGSAQSQLNTGPGHYRGSPMPGRAGNVVIAGRRSTYGAPFEQLGTLDEGDRIEVVTGVGRYDYRVTSVRRIPVGKPDVVAEDGTNKLTLVTAGSPLDADGRIAVTARMAGSRGAAPTEDASADESARALPDAELGLARDATAWAPFVIWGQVLIALVLTLRWLRGRWTPAAMWLVGAPTVLAVVVLFYESAGRLLPATL